MALVTGASRGIGKGIALEMARWGASVAGVYVSSDDRAGLSESEIKALGVDCRFFKCDVGDEAQVNLMAKNVLARFGKVDFVINNAGIHQHIKSWEMSYDDWQKVLRTNLDSCFLVTKAFTESLRDSAGAVINISSCVAFSGTDHEVHYGASKAGVIGLTKSLALELAPEVTVNAIAPGYIHSDMTNITSEEEEKCIASKIPAARIGVPFDIGAGVAFLCSPGARYITGQTIHVNGGLVMV